MRIFAATVLAVALCASGVMAQSTTSGGTLPSGPSSLETEIRFLSAQLQRLGDTVRQLTTEIRELEEEVGDLSDNVDPLDGKIQALSSAVTKLSKAINDRPSQAVPIPGLFNWECNEILGGSCNVANTTKWCENSGFQGLVAIRHGSGRIRAIVCEWTG